MRHWLGSAFLITALLAGLMACDNAVVYNHYEHTQLAGWEKNDTLFFNTQRVAQKGRYRIDIGLRTTGDYPFTGLSLRVEQHILPANTARIYTLNCKLAEKNGAVKGSGVAFYQYDFPLADIDLQEGDSVVLWVRHDMKREILPGIADVGIKLSRKQGFPSAP